MLYEKSNISRIVRRLHPLGLIQIEPCKDNARRQVISPMGKGSLAVVKGKKIISDSVERWSSRLTDYESTETLSKLIWLNILMRLIEINMPII